MIAFLGNQERPNLGHNLMKKSIKLP